MSRWGRNRTSRRPEVTPAEHKPTDYGQTRGWRPPSTAVTCTRCGGFYVDDDDGRHAHRVVFGHGPAEAPS